MTVTYRMPAEWEQHEGTWLAWPHRRSDWPGKMNPIPWVYSEIVRVLSRHERVNIVVADREMQHRAHVICARAHADMAQVRFLIHPTNRSWLRDSGPIFAQQPDGDLVALDWHFNAWAKYEDWQLDDLLPAAIAVTVGVPTIQPARAGRRIVLEGGSIDVNGQGCMLTTEECLLSPVQERNPGFTRQDYETLFAEYLGISHTIWLNRGIMGDDTHGHVDDLARFVNPHTIVTVVEDDPKDDNYLPLQENLERLQGLKNTQGQAIDVVSLPMPDPVYHRKQRLPASYANFYIANGVVIVPTFNDAKDRLALGRLQDLFPDRKVIGIHSGDLIWGLGTLHCMTQQELLAIGE